MKKGCLLFFLLFIAASFVEWQGLKQFQPDVPEPVAILIGLLITATVANLYGIYSGFRQKQLLSKDPTTWQEGKLIGVTGRINATRSPLVAPGSGKSVVLYEYDIKRTTTTGSGKDRSTTTTSDYMGFGMAPCAIQTRRGGLKLVGFPMLANFKAKTLSDEAEYNRMYDHLSSSTLTPRAKGLKGALQQINEVLKDEDGDVRLDLRDPGAVTDAPIKLDKSAAAVLPAATASSLPADDQLDGDDEDDFVDDDLPPISSAAEWFAASRYSIEETIVENGSQVTAFGTYHANPQRLDVGGILDTFSHAVFPGEGSEVAARNMRRSAIAFVIFAAIAGVAHYYLYPDFAQFVADTYKSAVSYLQ